MDELTKQTLKMILGEVIYSTVANKCPRCHQGSLFTNNNPYSFKNGLQMEKSCSCCGEVYEKGPGYFYGAMYVSYALMSGWFMVWFALDSLWLHLTLFTFMSIIVCSVLLFIPLTFRWSRTIWLNFFVRYQKNKTNVNC